MTIKTDIVHINSDLNGKSEAVITADQFIKWNKLTGKNALHIRLLTEELICMIHGIMEGFIGNLWLESNYTEDGVKCRICLSANRTVDPKQETKILSIATTGKNEYAKGILGKIREAFRVSAQHSADGVYMNEYSTANYWYSLGLEQNKNTDTKEDECCWSLRKYRDNLSENSGDERDELEKSIIGKLADDVKVWITADTTEVVIEKLIAVKEA